MLVAFLVISSIVFVINEPRLKNGFNKISSYRPLAGNKEIFSGSLPKRGVLGYVSERKSSEIYYDIDAARRYYMTQYDLAPLIIDNNPGHPLLIGNFEVDEDKVDLIGYRVLQKGKFGLYLLEKQD